MKAFNACQTWIALKQLEWQSENFAGNTILVVSKLSYTGRYKNIIRPERKCTNCSKGDIEDEKHFIVDFPLYENIRVKFFDKVIDF